MPDIVDKIFDYTSYTINGISSAAQSGFDVSKDVAQYSYDTSKWITERIYNGTAGTYSKVKDTLPDGINIITQSQKYLSPSPPPTVLETFGNILFRNKATIGLGITGTAFGFLGQKIYRQYIPITRVANRLEERFRYEVVLICGSINSKFVYKLVNDMNRRGFVVYITVCDEDELRTVEKINDPDVKPLVVDYTNDSTVKNSLLKLAYILDSRITDVPSEAYYHFKGVLLIPNYSSLPKLKGIDEVSSKEFLRITDSFFLRYNTLLSNGLLSILRESNLRKTSVEEYNKTKISGGYSKLIFVNFLTKTSQDSRRLVHDISKDINKTFFEKVYEQYSTTFQESCYRLFGKAKCTDLIDVSSLDITLHKKSSSRMQSTLTGLQNLFQKLNPPVTSDDIHNQIFDLLSKPVLSKNYNMSD